ncbi:hypothetical protein SLH49_20620 [Cognatiyoonia sp. IB215446]|uniref:hypothetical protein n=1 Tax=Cognatiyoonia sp. IB215446 TaxID=3097355 RepID=UPI002A17503F|nr:hypothetical protein [Cognatiyoonia sp. IB215446]MDX8350400.1 hypothetical protein [Cognatiyoonia sp. IB215446]
MLRFVVTALLALIASHAAAQEGSSTVSSVLDPASTQEVVVAFGVSTLGANIETAYRINPNYQVRGILMGGIDADFEETDEDGDFSGNVTLGGVALMGDFYPLQSGWRVSGGLLLSNTELSGSGTAEVEGAGRVEADVSAQFSGDINPMLTTGYDLGLGRGWSLNTEAGVIFTGGIDVTYTADDPALQDELDSDPELQEIVEDASDIAVYPYASVAVSFRF